jgi:hypothetical protein
MAKGRYSPRDGKADMRLVRRVEQLSCVSAPRPAGSTFQMITVCSMTGVVQSQPLFLFGYLIQVIGPPLHHFPAFREVLGMIVNSSHGVPLDMG